MDSRGKTVEVEISEQFGPPDVDSSGLQLLSNTALLDADDHNLISPEIEVQREQVDPIIALHHDSLRRTLVGVLHRAAEEKAAKTFREKELELEAKFARTIELEKMVSHYKAEAEWQQSRVNYMERANESLTKQLEDANKAARVDHGGESSYDDPGRVRLLGCKLCKTGLPTVMALPCRHACLCTGCDASNIMNFCLVCWAPRTSSVELRFPLD